MMNWYCIRGWKWWRLAALCCCFAYACWPSALRAQSVHIPDALSLTDQQFFSDTVAARWFQEANARPSEDAAGRMSLLMEAYKHAGASLDFAAQGICGTEIAAQYLRQGNVNLAFTWVNHSLSLDSVIPPLSPLRQRMHRNLAGIYSDFEAYKLALPHFKLALAIDMQRDPITTPRRYRHCSSIAICFQQAGQRDSANLYFRKAIDITRAMQEPLYQASALNNYGMAMQLEGRQDSALAIFERSYRVLNADQDDELAFAVSVRDNWGLVLLELGRAAEALTLFQQNWDDYAARPHPAEHAQAGLRIAQTLVALRRGPEARRWLRQVEDFVQGHSFFKQPKDVRLTLETGIDVARANGDWKGSSALQAQLLGYLDSLRSNAIQVKVRTLEEMLLDKADRYQTELALSRRSAAAADSRAHAQRLFIISISLLAIAALAFLAMLLYRRNERNKARHEQALIQQKMAELGLENERLANEQLNQELRMKQRDIVDYALVYSQRRKIFDELLEDLQQIKRSPRPERSVQELINTLRGKMDSEGKLNLEADHIEQVNHAFFDTLRQQFPSLGPSEVEICGMIRLGYTAKDIATIRNIAPASVRIAKTRLKKKMGLGPDIDLAAFLTQL